ncbi:MAG: hypothetical protein V1773_03530, partial [bacterium]
MKHVFTIFLCFICLLSVVKAQITMTSTDVNNYYSLGNTLVSHQDTLITNLNIGAPGDNTWDFFSLASHTEQLFTSVDVASSPFIADFPTANIVLKTPMAGMGGVAVDYYTYANLSSGSFVTLGGAMEYTYAIYLMKTSMINTPGNASVVFPATYNTQWTDVFTFTAGTTMNGNPINSYNELHTVTYNVDAYGMARMPGGDILPALRIREDNKYIYSPDGSHRRKVSYTILTKSGFSVSITAVDTSAPDNGFIDVTKVSWTKPNVVGVEDKNQIVSDYSLVQNYPNPFNPSTTIRFTVTDNNEEIAKINIFNSLGELVSVLSV